MAGKIFAWDFRGGMGVYSYCHGRFYVVGSGTMILPSLLAVFNLVLSTTGSMPDAPAEKVLKGGDEAEIWIVSKKPRVKIETHRGFTFNIDFATHGALSLANLCLDLNTQPKGLTLSFDPGAAMLAVDYDKEKGALRVLFGTGHTPVSSVPLPLTVATTRVLFRQREQLALYAIPQNGEHVTLVWLGTVSDILVFRNASQYDLCSNLKISMGKRDITLDEFRKGIKLTAMDQIEDVTVTGTNPAGETFAHRYAFDYAEIQKRADGAYMNFLRAAGNTLLGGEEEGPKGMMSPAPEAKPDAVAPDSGATPAASPMASPSSPAASPVMSSTANPAASPSTSPVSSPVSGTSAP